MWLDALGFGGERSAGLEASDQLLHGADRIVEAARAGDLTDGVGTAVFRQLVLDHAAVRLKFDEDRAGFCQGGGCISRADRAEA